MLLLWVLLVLYPNPWGLVASVRRVISPGIDPVTVTSLSEALPSDPAVIEAMVLQAIPYAYDWETYGVPWYCPSVEEVLEKGKGDCKSRALVLGSVFEAKDIPYTISWSPLHVWVDYEGKEESGLEKTEARFYEQNPETGERSFQLPEVPLREATDLFWKGFWGAMPEARKVLLFCGLAALVAMRLTWFRRGVADPAQSGYH